MVIQVLNSKLGIILRVLYYITCLCIFVYGSLGREDGCRCDRNTYLVWNSKLV